MAPRPGLYAIAIGLKHGPVGTPALVGWYMRKGNRYDVVPRDGFKTYMPLDVAETVIYELRAKHPTLLFHLAAPARINARD